MTGCILLLLLLQNSMYGWSEFLKEMQGYYKVGVKRVLRHPTQHTLSWLLLVCRPTGAQLGVQSHDCPVVHFRLHHSCPLTAVFPIVANHLLLLLLPLVTAVLLPVLWLQVDLDCLSDSYRDEQREYYLSTSAWAEVHPAQLLGPGVLIKSYDLNKVTLEELQVSVHTHKGVGATGGRWRVVVVACGLIAVVNKHTCSGQVAVTG